MVGWLISAFVLLVLTGTVISFYYSKPFVFLKICYFEGIQIWAKWLPFIAILFYLWVLLSSLTTPFSVGYTFLKINQFLSPFEMLALLSISVLFLTKLANVAGLLSLSYLLFTSMKHSYHSLAFLLVFAALTVISLTADKLPWLTHAISWRYLLAKTRAWLTIVMAYLATLMLLFSTIKIGLLHRWLQTTFSLSISASVLFIFLLALLAAWILIAFNISRHILLPLVSIPSLIVFSYFSQWPTTWLIIPFTACLMLALDVRVRYPVIYKTAYY